MEKSIVVITAHCDDQEKLDILVDCVSEIKSQGYVIIISSHIQVPNYIYDMVDYVIYDKENPIIYNHEFKDYGSSTTWLWTSYSGFYQEYTFDFNHGYAVLKLIKNGAAIAKINGYDISHVVCYDYIIKDKNLLKTHIDVLQEYDVYSYEFKGFTGVSAGLFSFRNDKFLETFGSINSKNDYSNSTFAIFENFLEKLFISNSAKIFKRDMDEIRNDNIIDKFTNLGNLTKNVFSDVNGRDTAYLFLTKVDENYYIYFISLNDELTLNVNIGDGHYQIKSKFQKSNLMPITNEQLKSGIKVEISELGITDFYNLESRLSTGRIDDNNIILNIDDIRVN
jgi:hypothetical protein